MKGVVTKLILNLLRAWTWFWANAFIERGRIEAEPAKEVPLWRRNCLSNDSLPSSPYYDPYSDPNAHNSVDSDF